MYRPVTVADIIAEARTWTGTPWHHQASVKGVGTDCAGVVRGVGNALGLMDCSERAALAAQYKGYGRIPEPARLKAALDQWMRRIARTDAGPGDVLLLRAPDPQHLAIVTERETMIHAAARHKRVVETPLPQGWRQGIVGAWRYRYA